MDRASDSGSEGWGFESLPVYQKSRYPFGYLLFCCLGRKGLEKFNATVRLGRCDYIIASAICCLALNFLNKYAIIIGLEFLGRGVIWNKYLLMICMKMRTIWRKNRGLFC